MVESPFAALRLRTDAAKRYKKVGNATVVIWKMLMLAKRRFRRLEAPEKQVYLGFGDREEREVTEIKREEVLAIAGAFFISSNCCGVFPLIFCQKLYPFY